MMEKLIARAGQIARAAQARRLQQIAAELGASGVLAESGGDALAVRGRGVAQRWLSDPLLRFVAARTA
jgi:hypothetical protein